MIYPYTFFPAKHKRMFSPNQGPSHLLIPLLPITPAISNAKPLTLLFRKPEFST
jgi:hypothetical protein